MLLLLLACGDVSITKVETDNDHDGYNVEVDCDDAHQTVNPDAAEICDGLDNNCDGEVDNGVSEAPVWYADVDGDGYGDPTVSESACDAPDGFVADNTDCLDQEEAAFPGNPEICDGIDNDCNDVVDDDPGDVVQVYADADGDGYGSGPAIATCAPTAGQSLSDGDCNDGNAAVHPGAAETDCTDPTDYNCDGSVAYADADADGSPACEDCNDANPDQHPGALEICNSLDDDCDQLIDDADPSLSGASTFYRDLDGDGYAGNGPSTTACSAPLGYSASTGDCDDGDASIHPGATEVCDSADTDEDCNGSADDADAGTDPSTWSTWYRDGDGDSYGDSTRSIDSCDPISSLYISADGDCDDLDANVHPGALESCNAVDDDCDSLIDDDDPDTVGLATWYRDADADRYGDPGRSGQACTQPSGYVANATDCNDSSAAVNPAATEICDNLDNNCDGQTDEGLFQTWYRDADADNYGLSSNSTSACTQPTGYVSNATDCNDASAAVYPGATEICDSLDNDCDGQTDEGLSQTWYRDADADNYGTSTSSTSACTQPTGYVANATDCNDASAAVYPGATEICDSLDNDCDGQTDEGLFQTWYRDADADNYGASASSTSACAQPVGYVSNATDCNDASAAIYPGATEICDSLDNDCDGQTDEGLSQTWYRDADADNYGASASSTSACAQPVGYVANATDCNDASSAVNPGATEICDSLDNNCNGTTDEGCGSRILTGEFLSSDYDTKIYGDSQNDYFGSAVAGGDFNGDGLVDIAVGAPDDEYSTNSNLGVVYLYNGAMASGVQLCTDQDDALLYSNSSGSYPDFGEFMWTLPDYSGDGRPELAVGSNQNYYNQIAVFTAGPYSGALSLATRTTSYTCSDISGSGNFSSTVGNGVACGYVSSGTAAGVVYIYGYGSSVPVATLNPEAGAKLTGYGLDVEQDIDGDGVNDAVVGAPQANTGGAAYIVMGPVNGSFNLANYDLKIQGPSSAGSIAERVLVAELDGDGRMDIVISDHNYNYGSRSSAGAFRVVTSLPSGILSWDQADTSIYGSARADGLGYHPASSGDVDGDGTGDLLVSSWGNGGNGVASGVAWLLYGPLSAATVDLATDYDARWFGESTYTYLGTAAIIAGDTNGDGFDDVVLNSVFGDEGSAVDRGAVWLFLGG